MSTEPRQSEMLWLPFRARSVALKPAHFALHRFTSRVITVVPQSTVRSELSKKRKNKNGNFEILWTGSLQWACWLHIPGVLSYSEEQL